MLQVDFGLALARVAASLLLMPKESMCQILNSCDAYLREVLTGIMVYCLVVFLHVMLLDAALRSALCCCFHAFDGRQCMNEIHLGCRNMKV